MAIIDSNQTVSSNKSGFEKQIQRSANTMILDNLQTFMYQKPIQSAVRECVSNAVDSVKEKMMAMQILNGKAKVEDYYISKESVADKIASADDDIYEDSEFNREYYDLAWLDENNTVTLTYKTNEQSKRDEFIITDPGVGLGRSRLEGFFNLGYSSKRLNTNELGGFGLGAKSPLSTGVESYRVTSRYNGKEFCFDIYSHKVDCVYGKWNDDGTQNETYEFRSIVIGEEEVDTDEVDAEGQPITETRPIYYKAHYKKTNQKNGVTISIEVKKHNRQQYFEAVKSQLMYLKDDIKFYEQGVDGRTNEVNFKANILYEDDNIIMSDYNYYSRPHFVIKNVGYGLIDFNELDLSVKFGNIGIKVKMEDINVTPSRETVIYSTKTREAVLAQYDRVSQTVEQKIQETLNQDDFIEWVRACNRIMYSGSNSNDTITRLSSLIDKSSLKPKFNNSEISFNSDVKQFITPLLNMTHSVMTQSYSSKKNKYVKKLSRSDADSLHAFDKPIYLQFTQGNSRVTTYLASIHGHNAGFCTIRLAQSYKYLEDTFNKFIENKISKQELLTEADALFVVNETDSKKLTAVREMFTKTVAILEGLNNARGGSKVEIYSEKLVPDGFKAGDNEEDGDDDEESELDFETNYEEERKRRYAETLKKRRENKSFIANLMCNKRKTAYSFEAGFSKSEVSYNDLDFENTQVLYGTDDDAKVFDILMEFERSSSRSRTNEARYFYWNDDIKIMKLAKSNIRYVKSDAGSVRDYVIRVDDNGVLKTCDKIRNAFTADALSNLMGKKCEFMRNFREFSIEIADDYEKLTNFIRNQSALSAFSNVSDSPISKTLQAAYHVQAELLKHSKLTEEEKQDLIDNSIPQELDLDIIDIDLIDKDLYEKAVKLLAFSDVYGSILSYIEPLQDHSLPIIKPELVFEIKSILNSRLDQLEYQYGNINN